ncbi:nuclear transport factor 2 family protein [Novosphingobium sp. ST904]|uniref:nuclear transport factor 2 family protein n=1 Tax=Novosphingobium sp. ST904 TaxID=1684385 RepID=UPI0006C86028|nr:nuclear transport factor 2 family protein [Novosphingobium sp. ST904]TCM37992.1 SnoaL-like protein [Novosphingobium sp. ST904]
MADREDIVEVLNLYGLAMDTRRWDLFGRVFTADCAVDYGPGSCWNDLGAFQHAFGAFHEMFDATQHVMSNHLVRVEEDRAFTVTYGQWRLIRHAAGQPPVWDGSGYYDDELVRTENGWRIARRSCRVLYWTGNPRVQMPEGDIAFELDLAALHEEERAGRIGYLPT